MNSEIEFPFLPLPRLLKEISIFSISTICITWLVCAAMGDQFRVQWTKVRNDTGESVVLTFRIVRPQVSPVPPRSIEKETPILIKGKGHRSHRSESALRGYPVMESSPTPRSPAMGGKE